jgi:hypothetical protein
MNSGGSVVRRTVIGLSITVWVLAGGLAKGAVPPRIAAGGDRSLGLKSDGMVVAWGRNNSGQSTIPPGLSNVTALAAGEEHTVVLKKDGSLTAWGDNNYKQCTIPAALSNGVIALASMQSHTLALKSNGTVVAWGYNGQGQTNVPPDLTHVKLIGAGAMHSVALKEDGSLVYWGTNSDNQYATPPGLSNVTALVCGLIHTVALQADGKVVAWGYNGAGQCTVPPGLSDVIAIGAGHNHTLAVRSNGTVVAWGANAHKQCDVPAGLSNVMAVAGGYRHSVALKADGTVAAWGTNNYGQCDVPAGLVLLLKPGQLCMGAASCLAKEGVKKTVWVKRINGADGTVSVSWSTKPKTALPWKDYTPKAGTLTWTNGETASKPIKIPIRTDGLVEGNEAFQVLLKKPVEATLGIPAKTKITILANSKGAKAGSADTIGDGACGLLSWEEAEVEGPGTLAFDWRVNGAGMETGVLIVNGRVQRILGRGYMWSHAAVALGEGPHTIRWVCVGSAGVDDGVVSLDNVVWTAGHVTTPLARSQSGPGAVVP